MNASASIRNSSSPVPAAAHDALEHDPLESHVVGLGRREGGEVVLARPARSAQARSAPDVERVGPVQRPPALEGAARATGQHPVDVGAAGRVAAGVEAGGGGRALDHRDVVGQQRVDASRAGPARPRSWRPGPRVHAGIGAPGDGERHARRGAAPRPAPAPARPAPCAARAGAPSRRTRSRRTRSAAATLGPALQPPCHRCDRHAAAARPAPAGPSRSSPTAAGPASGSGCSRRGARCSAERSPRTACRR